MPVLSPGRAWGDRAVSRPGILAAQPASLMRPPWPVRAVCTPSPGLRCQTGPNPAR